jgi:isopentenyl diphosphate isomerase/L-lactate dehydrogenase-like FMN-dependent dehydrogenase
LRRSDVGEERTRCAQVGASEFARCHIHESRAEGIVTAEDATVALRYGVDGVLVSNHGGRSEESLRSSIEALPEVIEAVGGKVPTMVDSGFRRGSDIFTALALGADGVGIGRPYVWGARRLWSGRSRTGARYPAR